MTAWPYRYKIPDTRGTFATARTAIEHALHTDARAISARVAGIELRTEWTAGAFVVRDMLRDRPDGAIEQWWESDLTAAAWHDALTLTRILLRVRASAPDPYPDAPAPPENGDTYPMPEHGWVCFHCGERFTNPGSAERHFGPTPSSTPACQLDQSARSLLHRLRAAEYRIHTLRRSNARLLVGTFAARMGRDVDEALADFDRRASAQDWRTQCPINANGSPDAPTSAPT